MTKFCDDLAHSSVVDSPANSVSALYNQYVRGLADILDQHVPLIIKNYSPKPCGWVSDAFQKVKHTKHQYERMWRRDKTQLSRSKLRRQINACS